MSDLKILMEKLDSMSKAAANSTGPKFPGYWQGSDSASKAKNKMVGSAQESIVKEISQTAKDTAVKRKLENAFQQYKKTSLEEAVPKDREVDRGDELSNYTGLSPQEIMRRKGLSKPTSPPAPARSGPAAKADIDLAKRAGIADPNLIRPGQVIPGAGPGGRDYVVQPGDTLSGIRQGQYAKPGQSSLSPGVQSLAQQNRLADPNRIMPGQKLTMPDGSTYTVKPGDTLSGIERNYRNRPPIDAAPAPAPAPAAASSPPIPNSRVKDLPSDDARSPDGSAGLPPSSQSSARSLGSAGPGVSVSQDDLDPRTRQSISNRQPSGVSVSPDDLDPRTRQSITNRPGPTPSSAAGGYTPVDQIRNNQFDRVEPEVSADSNKPQSRTIQSEPQRSAPAPAGYDQALERSRRLQALQSVAGERGPTRPGRPAATPSAPAPRPAPAPDPYAIDYGDAMTRMQGTPMSTPVKESAWLKQLSEYKKFLEYGNAQDPNAQTTTPKTGGNPEQQKKQQEQTRDIATAKGTMAGLKNLLGPDVDTNAAASAVVKISDNEPLTGSEQQAMSALTPLIAKAAETPQVATSLKTALSTAGMLAKKGMA